MTQGKKEDIQETLEWEMEKLEEGIAINEGTVEQYDLPPIICCDFDGCLAGYKYGYASKDKIGNPIAKVVNLLRKLKSQGWFIIIHTCRLPNQIDYWLKANSIPYDSINKNPWNHPIRQSTKPFADVYIDDKAINPITNTELLGDSLFDRVLALKELSEEKYKE